MAESMEGDLGRQVLQALQGLSEQVKGLSTRMDKLEARMDRQLRAELNGVRSELHTEIRGVRMELQLDLGHMRERIDRFTHAQLMKEMGLYRELELYWMLR
jgi:hypothetical protein